MGIAIKRYQMKECLYYGIRKKKEKAKNKYICNNFSNYCYCCFCFQIYHNFRNNQISEKEDDYKTKPNFNSTELDFDIFISPEKLYSSNAILIRLKDNEVLMEKNSDEIIYPASLTKMMTAIVAIENLPNLNEKVKLTISMFEGLYEVHASMAGFQPDEEIKAIDLLYGACSVRIARCNSRA